MGTHNTISIIGTAKNAGKTTVLNKIIEEYKNIEIAITSIGLDGEKLDNITFHEKPRIKVYPKAIIATAYDCLKQCELEYVIHEKTNMRTPLGVIVIIEAITEGLVLVAGPSTNNQMKQITKILKRYNPKKILIDGALFRKSIANVEVADAVIIATGASYSEDINEVVFGTKMIVDQFNLKETNDKVKRCVKSYENNVVISSDFKEIVEIEDSIIHNVNKLDHYLNENTKYFYISGAINNEIMKYLISNRKKLKNLEVIVKDASHIIVKPAFINKLEKTTIKIRVLNQIEILLLTCNPYSPFGYTFDNNEFKALLSAKIDIDIVNVLTDLE